MGYILIQVLNCEHLFKILSLQLLLCEHSLERHTNVFSPQPGHQGQTRERNPPSSGETMDFILGTYKNVSEGWPTGAKTIY